MARINIEDSWWTDPLRDKAIERIGNPYTCDGVFFRIVKIAQGYQKNNFIIPSEVFLTLPHAEDFVYSGLIIRIENKGFSIRDGEKHLNWLVQKSEAGKIVSDKKIDSLKRAREAKRQKNSLNGSEQTQNETEQVYSSSSFSSSIKKEETTTTDSEHEIPLHQKIQKSWGVWNSTLNSFQIPSKNISPSDERVLTQAINALGLVRVLNALEGKRYEKADGNYDPKKSLSLDYCLGRNAQSGKSNHERLENLALMARAKNSQPTDEELKAQAMGGLS